MGSGVGRELRFQCFKPGRRHVNAVAQFVTLRLRLEQVLTHNDVFLAQDFVAVEQLVDPACEVGEGRCSEIHALSF